MTSSTSFASITPRPGMQMPRFAAARKMALPLEPSPRVALSRRKSASKSRCLAASMPLRSVSPSGSASLSGSSSAAAGCTSVASPTATAPCSSWNWRMAALAALVPTRPSAAATATVAIAFTGTGCCRMNASSFASLSASHCTAASLCDGCNSAVREGCTGGMLASDRPSSRSGALGQDCQVAALAAGLALLLVAAAVDAHGSAPAAQGSCQELRQVP
mmetsp:Transcript_87780/g.233032  ORF Transcript_87780/g.233032 Transcript_87780/m.233032 type:complete len:218 (-) Transcript_87780:254-907(-)